jgi:hypothetical protein
MLISNTARQNQYVFEVLSVIVQDKVQNYKHQSSEIPLIMFNALIYLKFR